MALEMCHADMLKGWQSCGGTWHCMAVPPVPGGLQGGDRCRGRSAARSRLRVQSHARSHAGSQAALPAPAPAPHPAAPAERARPGASWCIHTQSALAAAGLNRRMVLRTQPDAEASHARPPGRSLCRTQVDCGQVAWQHMGRRTAGSHAGLMQGWQHCRGAAVQSRPKVTWWRPPAGRQHPEHCRAGHP